MEQINDHRVSLSRGIARGLAHGLISYGQSREVIIHFGIHVIYPSSTLTRDCDIGYSMVLRCMRHLYDT